MKKFILLIILSICSFANANESTYFASEQSLSFRFEKVKPEHSKIQFRNQIIEDGVHNLFNFSYIQRSGCSRW